MLSDTPVFDELYREEPIVLPDLESIVRCIHCDKPFYELSFERDAYSHHLRQHSELNHGVYLSYKEVSH